MVFTLFYVCVRCGVSAPIVPGDPSNVIFLKFPPSRALRHRCHTNPVELCIAMQLLALKLNFEAFTLHSPVSCCSAIALVSHMHDDRVKHQQYFAVFTVCT